MCVWDGRAHEGENKIPLFPKDPVIRGTGSRPRHRFALSCLSFYPTAQMRLITCKKRQRLFAATESNLQG